MSAYLKYGDIKGESVAKGHEKWIEIDSVSFGAGRGISTPVGKSSKREASAPSLSEVSVTKEMDSTSTDLFYEACVGEAVEAKLDFVETGPDQLNTFFELTLTNAMISGYSVNSSGDRPREDLTINFTKCELRYTPYDDKHKAGTPTTAGYDLTQGVKV